MRSRCKQPPAKLMGLLHYDNVIGNLNYNTLITQIDVHEARAKEPKSRIKPVLQFPESGSISKEHFNFEPSGSESTGHNRSSD